MERRQPKLKKFKEYLVPISIISMILIFILPIPGSILDVLLATNIALSIIVLMNAVYANDALEMSVFPTVLLSLTLFRVALNVATTKLILVDGDAGGVIENFGSFVAAGNIVVGLVIFLILLIVNFLVITKGTERVSEVAARFTLDAMPGKQMAIDADLNSGLVTEQEAKARRLKIQREADFYGAMDGATKYVKGDAIAGIIITLINIIGGLVVGIVMRGEDVNFAIQTYTILTIGDGLVSQIPALLVSFATGLIVTRSTSDDTLTDDLKNQIFYNPKVMYLSAGLCFLLSFALPRIAFMSLSILLAFLGYSLSKAQKQEAEQEEAESEENQVEEIRKPENVVSLLHVDPIELEFGYGIIPLADIKQGGDLLDRVVMIRRQLALEFGMIVPVIRLRDNIQLGPNQYVIKIKGVEISRGELMLDHLLAMNSGEVEREIEGIKTKEPAFGLPAVWVSESMRDRAEMLGYTVVDAPSIISTHLTEIIKRYSHELLGRQEVQSILDNVKEHSPASVEELIPKLLTLGEMQKVLANLLREGISIRDMVTIVETLADYSASTRDTDVLTEYVRQALGRSISKKFLKNGSNVLTLDPNLEQLILDSVHKTEQGAVINLDPNIIRQMVSGLSGHLQKFMQGGEQPVILASPMVRLYFKRILEQNVPGIIVLSYNEIDPATEVQSIGMVSV
jgi:flagellar biosynthesis protein FlhA